jgi:hypothetical protein
MSTTEFSCTEYEDSFSASEQSTLDSESVVETGADHSRRICIDETIREEGQEADTHKEEPQPHLIKLESTGTTPRETEPSKKKVTPTETTSSPSDSPTDVPPLKSAGDNPSEGSPMSDSPTSPESTDAASPSEEAAPPSETPSPPQTPSDDTPVTPPGSPSVSPSAVSLKVLSPTSSETFSPKITILSTKTGVEREMAEGHGTETKDEEKGGTETKDEEKGGTETKDEEKGGIETQGEEKGGIETKGEEKGGTETKDEEKGGIETKGEEKGGTETKDEGKGETKGTGESRKETKNEGNEGQGKASDEIASILPINRSSGGLRSPESSREGEAMKGSVRTPRRSREIADGGTPKTPRTPRGEPRGDPVVLVTTPGPSPKVGRRARDPIPFSLQPADEEQGREATEATEGEATEGIEATEASEGSSSRGVSCERASTPPVGQLVLAGGPAKRIRKKAKKREGEGGKVRNTWNGTATFSEGETSADVENELLRILVKALHSGTELSGKFFLRLLPSLLPLFLSVPLPPLHPPLSFLVPPLLFPPVRLPTHASSGALQEALLCVLQDKPILTNHDETTPSSPRRISIHSSLAISAPPSATSGPVDPRSKKLAQVLMATSLPLSKAPCSLVEKKDCSDCSVSGSSESGTDFFF